MRFFSGRYFVMFLCGRIDTNTVEILVRFTLCHVKKSIPYKSELDSNSFRPILCHFSERFFFCEAAFFGARTEHTQIDRERERDLTYDQVHYDYDLIHTQRSTYSRISSISTKKTPCLFSSLINLARKSYLMIVEDKKSKHTTR